MIPRLLIIDNYDSFTYNLVQAFRVLGAEVMVYRNDAISVTDAVALAPSHLVISPGPGRPKDAGISMGMIEAFTGRVPILGVCLGHQCIAEVFGGEIVGAKILMHGKTSWIQHDSGALYQDISNPLEAGRYHSLATNTQRIPEVLEVCATTEDNEVMGLRHRQHPIEGVQFHPESVLTPEGDLLMNNFLKLA